VSARMVGFTMHPRWGCGRALDSFLDPLRAAGLAALEFELDDNDSDWSRFGPLMEECQRLGFALTFHAPYHAPYTVAGFAGEERTDIKALYAPMLDIAASYGPVTVVVHGANSTAWSSLALLKMLWQCRCLSMDAVRGGDSADSADRRLSWHLQCGCEERQC